MPFPPGYPTLLDRRSSATAAYARAIQFSGSAPPGTASPVSLPKNPRESEGSMATDMVHIPSGRFQMGSEEFYPDERPVHEREVNEFLIDRYEVTNADFARFVDATDYVTIAERPLNQFQYPGVSEADLAPGSLVFTPTPGPVNLANWRQWWTWVSGAYWRTPEGPGSSIDHRMNHPVVHVAYADASAYAEWAGKRLPTEVEHEYAARGGFDGQRFAWGEEAYPNGTEVANVWMGRFPYDNRGRFGPGTAPIGSYPANGYGLRDMIGNVWEWTSDLYRERHLVPGHKVVDAGARQNLLPPETDPGIPRRVLKGGSYLCSPDYCLRFRPAARSPQDTDSSTNHIGFRCAQDV